MTKIIAYICKNHFFNEKWFTRTQYKKLTRLLYNK